MWHEFLSLAPRTVTATKRVSPASQKLAKTNHVEQMLKVLTDNTNLSRKQNDPLEATLNSLVSQKTMSSAPSTLLRKRILRNVFSLRSLSDG